MSVSSSHDPLVMGDPAGEQDRVDLPVQDRDAAADRLADLVDHRVVDQLGVLVAGLDHPADLAGVGGTEMVDEAAGLHEFAGQFPLGVPPGLSTIRITSLAGSDPGAVGPSDRRR